jgi:hypothetical protein
LRPDAGMWTALAAPDRRYRYCANAMHGVCNWLIPADSADELCAACRHNCGFLRLRTVIPIHRGQHSDDRGQSPIDGI